MDVTFLLDRYFYGDRVKTKIDAFDSVNIYSVYQRVIGALTQQSEIETTVLQAMSYCFYEILDNVITHSTKNLGVVLTCYDNNDHKLKILIADDGIGIQKSLAQNETFKDIDEEAALMSCINDAVTDGKGMGFGLYSTLLLIKNSGLKFEIHSGEHKLIFQDGSLQVEKSDKWQGTIVFMELCTNKEINPNEVVAYRTDCETQYNETFLNDSEIQDLW